MAPSGIGTILKAIPQYYAYTTTDIDKQLYKKYNLSDDEIDFIEKNVKEMK